jgi:hypothetical protein
MSLSERSPLVQSNPIVEQGSFSPQPAVANARSRKSRLCIDSIIGAKAAQQLGLVTASHIVAFGVQAVHLEERARVGTLIRPVRRVYRVASFPQSIEQHYLACCFAVPGAIISGIAAAMIHKLPVPRSFSIASYRGLPLVELRIATENRAVVRGVKIRRVTELGESIVWHGGLVTSVGETLLDLARLVDIPTLERCLDYVITEGQAEVAALETLIAGRPRAVNRALLLALLAVRDRRGFLYRSRLEQTVGGWLTHTGLPPFASNFIVPGTGVEVDFAWPSLRVVLEVSPFYTHGSREKQARDMERRRLLKAAGWIVVECTDEHLVSLLAFAPILDDLRQHL